MTVVHGTPWPPGSASDRDETLKPSITLTFGWLGEGEVFYNLYATLVGFIVRRGSSTLAKNGKRELEEEKKIYMRESSGAVEVSSEDKASNGHTGKGKGKCDVI